MIVACNIVYWITTDPFNPEDNPSCRSTLRTGGVMPEDQLPEWIEYANAQHNTHIQSFKTRLVSGEYAGYGLTTQLINVDTGEILYSVSHKEYIKAKNKTIVNEKKQAMKKASVYRTAVPTSSFDEAITFFNSASSTGTSTVSAGPAQWHPGSAALWANLPPTPPSEPEF